MFLRRSLRPRPITSLGLHPNLRTDFDVIRNDIQQFAKQFNIREVPYDPKFAAYFVTKLTEDSLPMVEIAQTASHFTLPIIEIENQVLTGELRHEGSSAVEWMMANLVMLESKFSGLKHPTKNKPGEKIDAPVAMLMVMGRALMYEDQGSLSFMEEKERTQLQRGYLERAAAKGPPEAAKKLELMPLS